MTDRFKFRAWHKPTKRLFEVLCFTPILVFENKVDGIYKIEDCVLEQSTGLKDKNSTLIYEGDIIFGEDLADPDNDNYGIGYIEWDDNTAQFAIMANDEYLTFDIGSSVIVMGNIHENWNLLE